MRKICIVITARTSYTKIKPILLSLKNITDVKLQIVLAASAVLDKYGDIDSVVKDDGFNVNEKIYMTLESKSLYVTAKSTGLGLIEFSGAFSRLKPDIVLVMADRFEVISAAIAAAYQNIPLAHVQGGEVSGNIDEKVRHAITKLSDIHFPSTVRSKEWLIKMGENSNKVFLTGCPSIDLAKKTINDSEIKFNLYEKYSGVGGFPNLDNGYIVIMQHPVTTEYNNAKKQISETMKAVLNLNKSVLWFWPNPDAGGNVTSKTIRTYREKYKLKHIHFIKNMIPEDFLKILYNSDGIVGNSSCAIRECSFLGVPAINIGSRQANRERGLNVIDVSYDSKIIKDTINSHCNGLIKSSSLYGKGNAGKNIAKILSTIKLSYSKTINYI